MVENSTSSESAICFWKAASTPPKINIEPKNDGLEDDFPLPEVYSQVPC